ncbi:MAG: trypsin-like peptidase domain-containing protein, partial [bacterium]|nr:trypsin-like peptidase domain-containing protein [bacterium]
MDVFENRSRFGPLPYVFGALLGVSLGLIIVSGVLFFRSSRGTESGTPFANASIDPGAIDPSITASRQNAIILATRRVSPAVVSITSRHTRVYRRNTRSPFARDWLRIWGIPETFTKQVSSLGSGVVISPDGYVLTNDHVVRNAEIIEITLATGQTLEAFAIANAPDFDLALLKVEEDNLPFAVLGNSDSLQVGEWAIAIGQPFGQLLYDTQPTVTVGVISALHRFVVQDPNSDQKWFNDMIQTDAAINPGNSGGPLVNARGQVVGINTFIFSTSGGGSVGIGFAIPINRGKWVLEEMRKYGRVREIWVGLTVRAITPQLAATLDIEAIRGLLISKIDDDSPAEQAKLKPGDLIMEINGVKVTTVQHANRLIFGAKVGDKLR